MNYLLPFASTGVGEGYNAFAFFRSSLPIPSGAENGTRTRAAHEWFCDCLSTPPTPERGVLRSRVTNPALRQNTRGQGEPFGSPCPLGAENGTRTRDLNLGKVALYQLSYFRKYLLLIASAKVTKICESPNFSVPFCNFFTITEPQDKSNCPPPASHTAYYQSDILHSEIKRAKSSGQSSPALRSRHRHPERS